MNLAKKILIIVGIVIGVAAVAGVIFSYFYFTKEIETITTEKDTKILELQEVVDELGTTTTVYYIATKVVAGQELERSHLEEREVILSSVTEQFVLTEADLEAVFYKVDMEAGEPLTYAVVDSEHLSNDSRYVDIVAHAFPVYMRTGSFVDIRINTDYGQDYLVIPKKRIHKISPNSVQVILNEEELMRYWSALVDSYLHPATMLYATMYVEPSYQEEAIAYYPVSQDVLNTMLLNPNLPQMASLEVIERRRERFETDLSQHTDTAQGSSVTTGRSDTLDKLLKDIEEYQTLVREGLIDPTTGAVIASTENLEGEVEEDEYEDTGLTPTEGTEE